jgi:hypothetical protein
MSIGIGIKECTQRIKDLNGVILGKTELYLIDS